MNEQEAQLIVLLSIAALDDKTFATLRKKWAFEHGLTAASGKYLEPPALASDFARDMHTDLDALAPDSDEVTVSNLWVYLSDLDVHITPTLSDRGKALSERQDELQELIGRAALAFCSKESLPPASVESMPLQDLAKKSIVLSKFTSLLDQIAEGKISTAEAMPVYWRCLASASLPFQGKVYSVGTKIKARWRGRKKKKWFFGNITAVRFAKWESSTSSAAGVQTSPTADDSSGIPLYDIYYPADKDKDELIWPHHVCERDTPIAVNDALFAGGKEGRDHDDAVRAIVACAPAAQSGDGMAIPAKSEVKAHPDASTSSTAAQGGADRLSQESSSGGSKDQDKSKDTAVDPSEDEDDATTQGTISPRDGPDGLVGPAPATSASTSPRPGDDAAEPKPSGKDKGGESGPKSSRGSSATKRSDSRGSSAAGSKPPKHVRPGADKGEDKQGSAAEDRPKAPAGRRPASARDSGRKSPRTRLGTGKGDKAKGGDKSPRASTTSTDMEGGQSEDGDSIVRGFRSALAQGSAPSVEALFAALDSTGDGRLSAKELLRASEVLGVPATESQLEELIRKHDPDGSGELDADEFALMCAPKPAVSGAGGDEDQEDKSRWTLRVGDARQDEASGSGQEGGGSRAERVARAIRDSEPIRQVRDKVRKALRDRTTEDDREGSLEFLEKVFAALDSDSSGAISPKELQQAARKLGVSDGISSVEARELCKALSGRGEKAGGRSSSSSSSSSSASDGVQFEDFALLVLLPQSRVDGPSGSAAAGRGLHRGRAHRGGSLVGGRESALRGGRQVEDEDSADAAGPGQHPLDAGWPPETISERQASAIEDACERLAEAVRDSAHVDDLYDKLIARSRAELAAEMRQTRGRSYSSIGARLPTAPSWWQPSGWQEEEDLEQLGVLERSRSNARRRPKLYGGRDSREGQSAARRKMGSVSLLGLFQVLEEIGVTSSLSPTREEERWATGERDRQRGRSSSRGSPSTAELVLARGTRLSQLRLAGAEGETSRLNGDSAARIDAQRFLAMVRRCNKGRSGGGGGKLGRRVAEKFERAVRQCVRRSKAHGLPDIQPVSLSAKASSGRSAAKGRRGSHPFSKSDYSRNLPSSTVDSLVDLDSGRIRHPVDLLLVAIRRHELLGRYQESRRDGRLSQEEVEEEEAEDAVIAKLAGARLRAADLRRMRDQLQERESAGASAGSGKLSTEDNPAARLLLGLSVGETKVLLGAVQLQCTNAEVAAFVCHLDGDGDGVLSGHEVLSLTETGEAEGEAGKDTADRSPRGEREADMDKRDSRDGDRSNRRRNELEGRRRTDNTSMLRALEDVESSVTSSVGRSTRRVIREASKREARKLDAGQLDVASRVVLPSLPREARGQLDHMCRGLERARVLDKVVRSAASAFRDGRYRELRPHFPESRRDRSQHDIDVDSTKGKTALAELAFRVLTVSAMHSGDRDELGRSPRDRRRSPRSRSPRPDARRIADRVLENLEAGLRCSLGRSDRTDVEDAVRRGVDRLAEAPSGLAELVAGLLAAPQAMVLAAFCAEEIRVASEDTDAAEEFLSAARRAGRELQEEEEEGEGGSSRRARGRSSYSPERTWRSRDSKVPREQYRLAQAALRRLKRFWRRQQRHSSGSGRMSRLDAKDLARSLDSNQDGKISRSEFMRWLDREARGSRHGTDLQLSRDEKDALWAVCDSGDRDAVRTRDFVAICVGSPDLSHLDIEASRDEERLSRWEGDGMRKRYRREDDGEGGGRYYKRYGRREDESREDRDRRWKDRIEAVRKTTRAEVSAMILRRIRRRLGSGDVEGGLVQVFEAADKDDSGYLGRDEFVSVLVACGAAVKSERRQFDEQEGSPYDRQLSLMDCDLLFSAFDHDGDGAMDLDEFIRWVESGEELLDEWEEQEEAQELEAQESGWAKSRRDLSSEDRHAYHKRAEQGMRKRRQAKALLLMQRQFKTALRRGKVRSVSELMSLFDEGKDGRVTVGEFERSLERVGVNVTARDLSAISERLDSNGDGNISSRELKELVESRGGFDRLEEELRRPLVEEDDDDRSERGGPRNRSRGRRDERDDDEADDRGRMSSRDRYDSRGGRYGDGRRDGGSRRDSKDWGNGRDRRAEDQDRRWEDRDSRAYQLDQFGHERRYGDSQRIGEEGKYDSRGYGGRERFRDSRPYDESQRYRQGAGIVEDARRRDDRPGSGAMLQPRVPAGYDFPMPPTGATLRDDVVSGLPSGGKDLLLRRTGYSRLTEKLAQIKTQCQEQVLNAFVSATSGGRRDREEEQRGGDGDGEGRGKGTPLPDPRAVLRFLIEQFRERDTGGRGVLPRRTVFQVLARLGIRLSREEQMCIRSAYRVRHPQHERRLQMLRASGATLGGGASSAVRTGDGTVASVNSAEHAELDYGRIAYLLAAPGAHASLELERVEEEARRRAGARSSGSRGLSGAWTGGLSLPMDSLLGDSSGLGGGTGATRGGASGDREGVLDSLGLGADGDGGSRGRGGGVGGSGDAAAAGLAVGRAPLERLVEEMLGRDAAGDSLGAWLQTGGSRVERVAVAMLGQSLTALETRLGLEGSASTAMGRLLDSRISSKTAEELAAAAAGTGLPVPMGMGMGMGVPSIGWGHGSMGLSMAGGRWVPPHLRASVPPRAMGTHGGMALVHDTRRSAAGPLLHPDGGRADRGRGRGRGRGASDLVSASELRRAIRDQVERRRGDERRGDRRRGEERDRSPPGRREDVQEEAMRLLDRALEGLLGRGGASRGSSVLGADSRTPLDSRRTSVDGLPVGMLGSGWSEGTVVVQLGARLEAHLAFKTKG